MNKLVVLLFFTLSHIYCFAQQKGYVPVSNIKEFQAALSTSNNAKQTISSDFTQVKNLTLLSDKIKSKGKFYFKKEDKVRIEYTSPYSYLLIMNNGKVLVKDEQKTTRVNTKNSKMMQSVNRVIIDCMQGTVFNNADFKVNAYQNANAYLLTLIPATEAMKNIFKSIDVYMTKKNFDVTRLTMTEQESDFTDMVFSNTQHNATLNDSIFKVK